MNPLIGRKNGKMTSNPIRETLGDTIGALVHGFERLTHAIGSRGGIGPDTVDGTRQRTADRPSDAKASASHALRSEGSGDVRARTGSRALRSSPATFSTGPAAGVAVSCVLSHSANSWSFSNSRRSAWPMT